MDERRGRRLDGNQVSSRPHGVQIGKKPGSEESGQSRSWKTNRRPQPAAPNAGRLAAAVASLRRALLIDPRFGLAAFQLGRAYDALGDAHAARAAYETALHTLDPEDARYDALLRQVDLGDVATAIRVRIQGLR